MSNTVITSVYRRFLNKISDYNFSLINNEKEVIEDNLLQLYMSATPRFPQCRKDLGTNYTNIEDIPSGEYITIKSNLTSLEQEIISKLMLIEYLRPVIIKNEVIEQVLGDSDFNLYSQANHLNQLQSLYNTMKKEVNSDISKYSFLKDGIYD